MLPAASSTLPSSSSVVTALIDFEDDKEEEEAAVSAGPEVAAGKRTDVVPSVADDDAHARDGSAAFVPFGGGFQSHPFLRRMLSISTPSGLDLTSVEESCESRLV